MSKTISQYLLFGLAGLALSACGGGGGYSGGGGTTTPTTATGVFKDENVIGLGYTSGGQTGFTGADGSFTYEVGQQVTFRVGNVTLGTTAGKSVVTPVDLVSGGTDTTIAVQNIARFLLTLDTDNNPVNGIQISANVRARAASWQTVDFTTANLAAALSAIIADANSADGVTHVLLDAATATARFVAGYRCARSGAFRGTYSGTASGRVMAYLTPMGVLPGRGYNTAQQSVFDATPVTLTIGTSPAFILGVTSSGASFSGQFTNPDSFSGSWTQTPDSGTFTASRVGGASTAKYRFSGGWSVGSAAGPSPLSGTGLFAFDIDAANQVTGTAYNIITDQQSTVTGSVTNGILNASAFSGGMTITSVVALTYLGAPVGGTFTSSFGAGGFVITGCLLN